MEYLHMQYPIDGIWNNITMTGVPVTLTAIDDNGNPTNIGTTTTNAYYGTFELTWTPPATGTYQIISTFAGDDSYASSGALTYISVHDAPTASSTPLPITFDAVNKMTLTAVIGAAIAIIIAIAIATVILLRRRP
jgi:hypothetical protein